MENMAGKKMSFAMGILLILMGTWSLLGTGCGGSKLRNVDGGAGEYYSEDEYLSLSNRQKNNYCNSLGAMLNKFEVEVANKQSRIAAARAQIDSLRDAMVPLERDVLRLESDIRTLEDEIAQVEAMPKTWLVKDGESLSLIAGHDEIYNDIDKWPKIFEANTDKIEDPYFIFPDSVLVIPRDWPTD
jgi:hypothetical protein